MPLPAPPHLSRGLYAITPDEGDTGRLLDRVEPVLLAGVACLQYRNKRADRTLRTEQAHALDALCRRHGVPLIINDDLALAEALGVGVHLGGDDGDLAEARARLGHAALIGASCYDSLPRARAAAAAGASYIAFGAFFPSATKPNARRATPDLLRDSAPLGVPRVAIGGITPGNGATLIAAGADLLAVIGALFDAPDPIAVAHHFSRLFQDTPP